MTYNITSNFFTPLGFNQLISSNTSFVLNPSTGLLPQAPRTSRAAKKSPKKLTIKDFEKILLNETPMAQLERVIPYVLADPTDKKIKLYEQTLLRILNESSSNQERLALIENKFNEITSTLKTPSDFLKEIFTNHYKLYKKIPEVANIPHSQPEMSPCNNINPDDVCSPAAHASNSISVAAACAHPEIVPVNRLPSASYQLAQANSHLVITASRFFKNPEEREQMNDKMKVFLYLEKMYSYSHLEKIQQLVKDMHNSGATLEELHVANALYGMLISSQILMESKQSICGHSVNLSMGKFIARHVLFNEPMPALLVIVFKTEFEREKWETYNLAAHYLSQHITLLTLPSTLENSEKLNQLQAVITDNIIGGKAFASSEDAEPFLNLLQELNPHICDAWDSVNEPLFPAKARSEEDMFTLFTQRPDLVFQKKFIRPHHLTSSVLQATIDYVFREQKEFWQQVLTNSDEYTNEASGITQTIHSRFSP